MMNDEFQPAFKNFQLDIEDYLISIGKYNKRDDDLTVFRGYDDALQMMFRRYLDHQAFEPLVTHFRSWNWEADYNDYLLELTTTLMNWQNWSLLQRLWEGVIAKRRRHYNEVWKIEKDNPGTLPSRTVVESKEFLLETLNRVKVFAEDMGEPGDADKYTEMIGRIQQNKKV